MITITENINDKITGQCSCELMQMCWYSMLLPRLEQHMVSVPGQPVLFAIELVINYWYSYTIHCKQLHAFLSFTYYSSCCELKLPITFYCDLKTAMIV